jgi:hypothetical protein
MGRLGIRQNGMSPRRMMLAHVEIDRAIESATDQARARIGSRSLRQRVVMIDAQRAEMRPSDFPDMTVMGTC